MSLEIIERPAFTVIGLQIATKPMSPEIPMLWPKFVPRIAEIRNGSEPKVSYGVMQHEPGSMSVLHYTAAIAVSAPDGVPAGMTRLSIPAGKYASFKYPISRLAKGFGEIFNRLLPSSNYAQAPGPYFERYDEAFDPGNPDSLVEICLPVRSKAG
jgi:AraC family transcriptional regulator